MYGSSEEITRSGIGRGEARIESEAEESLDDEVKDDTVDGAPSIMQAATQPLSDSRSNSSSMSCDGGKQWRHAHLRMFPF
jgi:hypothetical protein